MKTIFNLFAIGTLLFASVGCHVCEPNYGYSPFDVCPSGGYPLNANGCVPSGCVDICSPQCSIPVAECYVENQFDTGCAIDSCVPVQCPKQRRCRAPKMKFPSLPKGFLARHSRKNSCGLESCGCSAPRIKPSKPTCACPVGSDSHCADCGPSSVPSSPTFIPDGKATEPGCEKCQPKNVPPNVSLNFETVPGPPTLQQTYQPAIPDERDMNVPVPGASPVSTPSTTWQPPNEIQQQSYTVQKIPNVRLVPPPVDALPNGASAWQKKMPIAGQRELPPQVY